jgi:hypothetical protein
VAPGGSASTTLKMAALAPMPSARVSTAIAEKLRLATNCRAA